MRRYGLLGCLLVGCALDNSPTEVDASSGFHDAGATNPDFENGRSYPAEDPFAPPLAMDDSLEGMNCSDGIDNGGNGATDCEDSACRMRATCELIQGTNCAPAPAPAGFDAARCGMLDDCLGADAVPFGSPSPRIERGYLSLAGDERGSSGVWYATPIDLRSQDLTLRVTFSPPSMDCPQCLETAAVGLTDGPADGELEAPSQIALVAVGATSEVRLVLHGRSIVSFPETFADQAVWELRFRTNGTLDVVRANTVMTTIDYPVGGLVHPVLFGHNPNPSASTEVSLGIASFSASSAVCESPNAWSSPMDVALPIAAREWRGTALLATTGNTFLAVASELGVHFLRRPEPASSPERFIPAFDGALSNPLTLPNRELSRPSLTMGETGPLLFVYDEAAREFLRVELSRDWHLQDLQVLDLPEGSRDFQALPTDSSDTLAVAVVGSEVRALASVDGRMFQTNTRVAELDPSADDILSARAALISGAYQLAVTYRFGTRVRSALFSSDDFLTFRRVTESYLEAGDASELVGAIRPTFIEVPGAVHVLYEANDGFSSHLRMRTRPLPTQAESRAAR